jgi:8-oxo-dGTP pyrophosphatase MutT (NUDIX family)
MKEKLRQALSARGKERIINSQRTSAAVILPFYEKQNQYHILFTKRTTNVKNHQGQISFPGGAYQEGDSSLLDTALRECCEEIGLSPDQIEILGELDDTPTFTSNYIITPFAGLLRCPFTLKVNRYEIAEIIEAPVPALLDTNNLHYGTEVVDNQTITAYYYSYQGKVIWGATARILHQFLSIFAQVLERTS